MRTISLLMAFSALTVLALPLAAAAPAGAVESPCSNGICDDLNRLCGDCLPSGEAARCMGEVCDAINRACEKAFDVSCVG